MHETRHGVYTLIGLEHFNRNQRTFSISHSHEIWKPARYIEMHFHSMIIMGVSENDKLKFNNGNLSE